MAYTESHQSLARHPKTLRLMRRLGTSRATTIGHLHLFWWWCLDYAPDGDLTTFDNEEIAIALEWDGDADDLMDALVIAGFIDRDEQMTRVHDWDEYGGKLLKRKESNRLRMRETRAAYVHDTNGAPSPVNNERAAHVQRTSDARAEHVQSQRREEERREEKNTPQPPKGESERPKFESIDGGRKPPTPLEQRFDRFWDAYPKKRNKGDAVKVWKRLKPDAAMTDRMISAVKVLERTHDWQKEGGQFIPYPARWLNAGGWDDVISVPPPSSPDDSLEPYRRKLERLKRREFNALEVGKYNGFDGDRTYHDDLERLERVVSTGQVSA